MLASRSGRRPLAICLGTAVKQCAPFPSLQFNVGRLP